MSNQTTKKLNKYEQIRQDIVKYLSDGQMHSTLVGKVVALHGNGHDSEVNELAQYIANMVMNAENYRKKNDVKAPTTRSKK